MGQILRNRVAELVAIKARQEARTIRKMTLVNETGLNRGTIDDWLDNKVTRYDADVMLTWCNYLDCEIADLFAVEESEDPEEKAYSIVPQRQKALQPTA